MDWKKNCKLFAGTFKVKFGDNIEKIIGVELFEDDADILTEYSGSVPIKDCQLIARKIEDMTDEELVCIFYGVEDHSEVPYGLKRVKEQRDYFMGRVLDATQPQRYKREILHDRFEWTMYLLSIGVYPFDQKAFETGEVLDAKELS